ncbi:apolipoprotein N-acyltransferase [Cyanobium sp. PCC 7001]|uniref:apolipoprotein N-acyltransferase n=1 Tax=Cyanobium sp. PCC 7001 TaxID=180281 RepID=UPI0001804CC1|nr:apolipoprotein N-acyltransferase [Cyanobium sp. PCC 7001]EDY38879.1 apolipoprotein N-acyltransferase [Cyanobium sp. PCC 7001]
MAVEGRLAWIVVGGAGLLAGLALPPLGCPPLAWLALAVLWAACAQGPSRPLLLGSGLWGGLAVLLSHHWLLGLHPLDWIGVPLPLSLPLCGLLLLFCAALGGLLVAGWAWLAAWLGPHRGSTVLLLSGVWGLAEVLLAQGPLFWLGLGAAPLPHDRPLAGLAVLGGGGLLAAVQVLLGWGLWRVVVPPTRRLRRLAGWLLLVLVLHGAGAALLAGEPSAAEASERVLVLQPAIPTREKQSAAARRRLELLLQGAMEEAVRRQAAVVVLPEGALGLEPRLARPAPVELLSGGFRWHEGPGGPEQRSALLRFAPGEQQASGGVDKHRLVPLGEWVPLGGWWRWSGLSAVGGVEPGAPSRLLPRPDGSVAAAICYEISDGHALAAASRQGAIWLLASANLDPYPLMLQRQFEALVQLRAIETGRWLVSAANTGPSLLVNPQGRVTSSLAPGRAGMALFEPRLRAGLTPYGRFGEALLIGLVGVSALLRWRTGRPGGRAESASEAEGQLHQGEAQKPDQGEE